MQTSLIGKIITQEEDLSMHMRKKKWARPELAGCPYYAAFPEDKRGQWRKCFPAQPHLHLELGCGKGVGTAACALGMPGATRSSPSVAGL